MHLRSFRGNFEFHEKWTNGVLEAFRSNTNDPKHPGNITSDNGIPRNISGEKYDQAWISPKIPQKQPKIEGYNTHFCTFPWPEIQTARGAF